MWQSEVWSTLCQDYGTDWNVEPCREFSKAALYEKFNFDLPAKQHYDMKTLKGEVMDGWVRVLRPYNSISVISRRWKGEHERLCAMKCRLGLGRISPPAGFKPATPWSEVGSPNLSATWTLRKVRLNPKHMCIWGSGWRVPKVAKH